MKRIFGKTGLEVSQIGFGAWAIGGSWGPQQETDSLEALNEALSNGINFIDTAASYGNGNSERVIAKSVQTRKEKPIIASKIPPTPGNWPPSPYCLESDRFPKDYLKRRLDERLEHLETPVIDLLQIHTWTRAWNRKAETFTILQEYKEQGLIKSIGVSTPEHDQHAVIDLIKDGLVDSVQLIYNIFEQEPAAELLPVCKEHTIGVIVRVALDEGSLTGKFTKDYSFAADDFRTRYFAGDRLERTVQRVEKLKPIAQDLGISMLELAVRFSLSHEAVHTVILGMRNKAQALENSRLVHAEWLPDDVLNELHKHVWNRAFWHLGK
ncbi:aldo/keto reductase [bacterium]|nr:MAG: aldo/keto reductase [bacterium]